MQRSNALTRVQRHRAATRAAPELGSQAHVRKWELHVRKSIVTSATQPANMMCFTKLSLISAAWGPGTDLTFAGIQIAELLN
jgi:hypothetical protein